jgi:hypothetical protein
MGGCPESRGANLIVLVLIAGFAGTELKACPCYFALPLLLLVPSSLSSLKFPLRCQSDWRWTGYLESRTRNRFHLGRCLGRTGREVVI